MVEVRKREKENNQSLIYRFKLKLQKSGILKVAREKAFKIRTKSRQMKKEAALRREEKKREYEKLKKLGKINE
jgi:ribosomal protein S21